MPRPPSSDPFPQFWLNIGNSQCITWCKKVMSKKKDFLVCIFFLHFYLLVFWLLQDHCPVEWIVFKVACNGDVDHHHDDDDKPEKVFFVIECSAQTSPDQVTTGYLRFSNPLSSITIQFCKTLCLMRANELSILSDIWC